MIEYMIYYISINYEITSQNPAFLIYVLFGVYLVSHFTFSFLKFLVIRKGMPESVLGTYQILTNYDSNMPTKYQYNRFTEIGTIWWLGDIVFYMYMWVIMKKPVYVSSIIGFLILPSSALISLFTFSLYAVIYYAFISDTAIYKPTDKKVHYGVLKEQYYIPKHLEVYDKDYK